MAEYYAIARSFSPATGDARFGGSTWTNGQPMIECVLFILRTPRGTYLPDATLGVDYGVVQKARPDVAMAWRAAVLEGLRPLTSAGLITDVGVVVEPKGTALLYEVSFVDPADPGTRQTTGKLST